MDLGKYVTHFSLVLFLLFVGACDTETKWVLESHESQRYSFTQFIASIKKFPFTADQSKISRVKEGFKRLSLGMRKDDVKKIMGEPDYEMFHYRPKDKNKELIESTWGYYLKLFESDLVNESFDETVVLYFKPNEELYWGDPGNIADLKSLGGPRLYPEASIPIQRTDRK